jgi:(p)ppGpp synthase/HD superfamily hydrolase
VTGDRWKATLRGDRPQIEAAVACAEQAHAGQYRTDGTPFVLHPLEVGALLDGAGAPDRLIAAGVLHDVIEKTDVSAAELGGRFDPSVTCLVRALTDDPELGGYAARKAAMRRQVANAGPDALTIFAADKVSKLRELRRAVSAGGGWRELRARRLRHYQRSLALLEERLPGLPLVAKFRYELTALLREGASVAQSH